jgi:hypothetical protein
VSPETAEAESRAEARLLPDRLLGVLYTKLLRGESLRLVDVVRDYARWYGSLVTRGGAKYSDERQANAAGQARRAKDVRAKIRFLQEHLPNNRDWAIVLRDSGLSPPEVARALAAVSRFNPLKRTSGPPPLDCATRAMAAAFRMSESLARRLYELPPTLDRARRRLATPQFQDAFVRLALRYYLGSLQYQVRRKVELAEARVRAQGRSRKIRWRRRRAAGITYSDAALALRDSDLTPPRKARQSD